MSDQSDRESFDKRIAHLVAHKTPEEMAKELIALQDAATVNDEAVPEPVQDNPLDDDTGEDRDTDEDPDDVTDDDLPVNERG